MQIVRFDEVETYEPGGHHGVVNRLLTGRGRGEVEDVSIWHGLLSPGGGSDLHTHDHSVQIYVAITGTIEVSDGGSPVALGPGDTAIIPAGEVHDVHNRTDEDVTLLVISAPALR